jgi:hypothetical protein
MSFTEKKKVNEKHKVTQTDKFITAKQAQKVSSNVKINDIFKEISMRIKFGEFEYNSNQLLPTCILRYIQELGYKSYKTVDNKSVISWKEI